MGAITLHLVFLLQFIVLCYGQSSAADSVLSGCAPDWATFKEENCFKLLDKDHLHAYQEAETLCKQAGANLVAIHSKEEQDFLANYLFKVNKVVDNVWLGAKFGVGEKSKWALDGAELSYTNWAAGNPKNLADHCLELEAEEELQGKWSETACAKKNLVVCEKAAIWSVTKVRDLLLQTRSWLNETQKALLDTRQILAQTQQRLHKVESENPVPLGFIYVQLPKEKSPTEIWSSATKWTDVSSSYSGVFFRVLGDHSAAFGSIQEENAPHLTEVEYSDEYPLAAHRNVSTVPGATSDFVASTNGHYGTQYFRSQGLNFTLSGGEVRPRNMAVKVWKRTG